jgi:hypothetical protein
MKNLIILFFLTMVISSAFGQAKPEENKIRTYEISLINHPQKVELVEYGDGQYSGHVIT